MRITRNNITIFPAVLAGWCSPSLMHLAADPAPADAAGMKNALAAIASTLSLAALIGAGSAHAAAPSVTTNTGDEGTAISVPVSHRCALKRCYYDVRTVDGSATVDADYAAVQLEGKARRKRTFQRTLTIQTVDDAVCESDESFYVHFTLVRNGKAVGFDADETIHDNDCAAGQAPAPAAPDPAPATPAPSAPATPPAPPTTPTGPVAPAGPPVTTPANPSGAVITNNATPGTKNQSCLTPADDGARVPGTASGHLYAPPCFVHVQCPASASRCVGKAEASTAEVAYGNSQDVWGYADTDIVSATGTFRGSATRSCVSGFGICTATINDITLAAGEWLMLRCGGSHQEYRIGAGGDRYQTGPIGLFCVAKLDIS